MVPNREVQVFSYGSEWQRLAGALLLLGGASRELGASDRERERERAEKTKKKLLACDAAAILRPLSSSRLRAAAPPMDEKAASELPSRRRSRVQGPGALLSSKWWSASPSAGHGNGERVRPELRSAMAARR